MNTKLELANPNHGFQWQKKKIMIVQCNEKSTRESQLIHKFQFVSLKKKKMFMNNQMNWNSDIVGLRSACDEW